METIKLTAYNIHGQTLRSGEIHFNFEKQEVKTPRNKIFKVVNDYEFTYKIQKEQIKAVGGIRGLYDFINDINRPNSPFNPSRVDIFINL